MINCTQCGRQYEDGMRYCLDDGSPLPVASVVSTSDVPTAEYRNALTEGDREAETLIGRPVPVTGSVRTSGPSIVPMLVVVAVVIIGGIVLLAAAGLAGFWLYTATGTDDGTISTSNPPVRSSPTPLDTLGVSDPIKTDDSYPDNKVKKDPRTVDLRTEGPSSIDNTTVPPPVFERPDPPTGKPAPKQISGGVLNGKAISLPKPPYPPVARAVRASGAVNVQVLVDESGNVVSAHAVSGHPLLRAAATSAARGAKFTPTKLSGQPVKVSGVITYNFVAP